MTRQISGRHTVTVCAAVALYLTSPALADPLGTGIDVLVETTKAAAASQKRIDKVSDQTRDLLNDYRAVQQQIDALAVYNAQVDKLLASQQQELDLLATQIENATMIGRQITPLMLRMLEALSTFVKLDVPFLLTERTERIAALRAMMDRADVSDSEKYRRLLEAFQVENEYGRTIETYKGIINLEGAETTVDFLRVGRVVLAYLTLDGRQAGVWDHDKRSWEVLPSEYRSALTKGLRIARKQTAPDLIRLPVRAPGGAQ